jgi:hypothetical protein
MIPHHFIWHKPDAAVAENRGTDESDTDKPNIPINSSTGQTLKLENEL